MHNPHIDKVSWDFKTMVDHHVDDLAEAYIDWEEIQTADGQCQIVPLIRLLFKV